MSIELPCKFRVLHPLLDGRAVVVQLLDITDEGSPVVQISHPPAFGGYTFGSFAQVLYWLKIAPRQASFCRDRWKLCDTNEILSYFLHVSDSGKWGDLDYLYEGGVRFKRTLSGINFAKKARHPCKQTCPLEIDLKTEIGRAHILQRCNTGVNKHVRFDMCVDVRPAKATTESDFIHQAKISLSRMIVSTRVDALRHPISSALQCPVDRFDIFINRQLGNGEYDPALEQQHVNLLDDQWAELSDGGNSDLEQEDVINPSTRRHYQADFECNIAVPRARSFMCLLSCAFRWESWLGCEPQWPCQGPCKLACPPWQHKAFTDLLKWLETGPWRISDPQKFNAELIKWLKSYQMSTDSEVWNNRFV